MYFQIAQAPFHCQSLIQKYTNTTKIKTLIDIARYLKGIAYKLLITEMLQVIAKATLSKIRQ